MEPTSKLRFVVRIEPISQTTGKTVQILQQWWEDSHGDLINGVTLYGEWRDVPIEKEKP